MTVVLVDDLSHDEGTASPPACRVVGGHCGPLRRRTLLVTHRITRCPREEIPLTADTTVDVTPATPRRRHDLRRAGLLSIVIVAGFLGLGVSAEAAETTRPIRGTAHTGIPPVSTCTSEFVEEYKYPNEGYRVRASCTSLADWTEARGISTYPYDGHNQTEWFDQSNRIYWSEWNVQWRLPVGSLHPRDTKIEYRPDGDGMTLYTGSGRTTPDQDHPVAVTMPSNREGTVALFWKRPDGSTQQLDSATLAGGRAEMRIPTGAVEGGYQQVFATYQGSAAHEAIRTSSTGVTVEKAVPRFGLSGPYTHIPLGTSGQLTVSLPHAEGPIAIVDGDRTVGTVEMQAGRGILSTSLPEGEHQLRAVHRGDTRYLPGESEPVTLTVFEPRIEVESGTLQPGETLRATVSLPSEASGHVQFLLTWPGNMAGIGTADLVDGRATFSIAVDRIGTGRFGLAVDHRGGGGFMPFRSEPAMFTIGVAGASEAESTTDGSGSHPDERPSAEERGGVEQDAPDGGSAAPTAAEDA